MYKGSIKAINPPEKITGEFSFRATVHNESDRHWESAEPNPIHIAYHWLDEDWTMVVFRLHAEIIDPSMFPEK